MLGSMFELGKYWWVTEILTRVSKLYEIYKQQDAVGKILPTITGCPQV